MTLDAAPAAAAALTPDLEASPEMTLMAEASVDEARMCFGSKVLLSEIFSTALFQSNFLRATLFPPVRITKI